MQASLHGAAKLGCIHPPEPIPGTELLSSGNCKFGLDHCQTWQQKVEHLRESVYHSIAL